MIKKYLTYIKESQSIEDFKIGDKVTCIADHLMVYYGQIDQNGNKILRKHPLALTIGKDYTIKDITKIGYIDGFYIWVINDDRIKNNYYDTFDDDGNFVKIFSKDSKEVYDAKKKFQDRKRKERELKFKKRQLQLKNKLIDPYMEEDWGEDILESMGIGDFKIGDRVEYNAPGLSISGNDWYVGTIVDIQEDVCVVKFDDRWSPRLHDNEGNDPESKSYWCSFYRLIPHVKKERRITKEDPYGEEEWEINEKFSKV